MIDTVIAEVKEMEVRKVKVIEGTIKATEAGKADVKYRYIEVGFDDENGDRHTFKDKAVEEHQDLYHRGDIGTLYLSIITEDVSKKNSTFVQEKTKVLIHNFEVNKGAK